MEKRIFVITGTGVVIGNYANTSAGRKKAVKKKKEFSRMYPVIHIKTLKFK